MMLRRYPILFLMIAIIITHFNAYADPNTQDIDQEFVRPISLDTINEDILSFLASTQDIDNNFKIMDHVFYTGKIISSIKFIAPNQVSGTLNEIIEDMFNYIQDARNEDGGYANWMDGISSLESTFQALELYLDYGKIQEISSEELENTVGYILDLQVEIDGAIGFYPLGDWDAPDMTSTYRALRLLNRLNQSFSGSEAIDAFIRNNYQTPFFLGSPSGYSEIPDGKVDLLATYYAMASFDLLGTSSDHANEVAEYLKSLRFPNGGFAGYEGGDPTTGYTFDAIELFLILSKNYDLGGIFPDSTFESAINYIMANKLAGSGFSSSGNDITASLSSTYFAMEMINILHVQGNLGLVSIDFQDIAYFISNGEEISYGFGNYPGDIPDLSYGTRALLTAKLLSNSSWIHTGFANYLEDTYSSSINGFGFRPGTEPTIKYTYYGIRTSRAMNSSLDQAIAIKNYILSTQNPDGLFGKKPDYKLSYISYTYWALYSLKLLDYLNENTLDYNEILSQIDFYRNIDHGYTNFPGGESSLVSTFRALKIKEMLGVNITNEPFRYVLPLYQHPSGGFIERINRTVPTLEATYYAVQIADMLGLEYNKTAVLHFVQSLQNPDGGFATRPGFSSRISATYWAISLFYLIENGIPSYDEDFKDFFSPLIYPSFNPRVDTNASFSGVYSTTARIADPEGEISETWVEIKFYGIENEITMNSTGVKIDDQSTWSFVIGPLDEGYIKFRLAAVDTNGNHASTSWFEIISEGGEQAFENNLDVGYLLIMAIYPLSLGVSILDARKTIQKNKGDEIKMHIDNEKYNETQTLNIIYLMILIGSISALSRLLIGDALLVLQASVYLFQFLFAVLTILFLRYVVGFKSYGYFGPSVIALSWLGINPLWGLFLFVNLFVISVIVSNLLHPYGLPVGFRIGIGIVVLVTSLALLEMLGEVYKIDFLASSILIPVLITPWMSDRYVNESQETNHLEAFTKFGSTMIITSTAYLVMSWDKGVTFVATTPEMWILMVLVIFYFGRQRYYTYFDRRRFDRLISRNDDPLTLLSRNRDYISRYNQKMIFPLINKFDMKELFDRWRVPTAQLYAVVHNEEDIPAIMKRLVNDPIFENGFVIKPSESFGGRGIVVVTDRDSDAFTISGEKYHPDAIQEHITKILQGEFLTSQTKTIGDIAIIEEKIVADPKMSKISIGLADIRVILFQGVPIMAMSRLPTKFSDGKANLKQGAIGAAIDMHSGQISRAEYKKHALNKHPDTLKDIVGYRFENWKEILAVASLAQKSTSLGYTGVDLVIDEHQRVLVLEINKRPGLEIQNINLGSLLSRIKHIEENNINAEELSPLKAAAIGIELGKIWEEAQ